MKRYLKIPAIILGCIAILLLAAQTVLSGRIATSLVNRYVPEYLGADFHAGKAGISFLRRFPKLLVNMEDVCLSESSDTLASFRRFNVSARVFPMLRGRFEFPYARLEGPRIYYNRENDSTSNWSGFLSHFKPSEDTSSSTIPPIVLERVILDGNPLVTVDMPADTLKLAAGFRRIRTGGKINLSEPEKARVRLGIDSLFAAGCHKGDSVFFAMEKLRLKGTDRSFKALATAKLFAGTSDYGRMSLPLKLSLEAEFPEDSLFSFPSFAAKLSGIELEGKGQIRIERDSTLYIKAESAIDSCELSPLLNDYISHFWENASRIKTDARISLRAETEGYLGGGSYPKTSARLVLEDSSLEMEGLPSLQAGFEINAEMDSLGILGAQADSLRINGSGVQLLAGLSARDILGEDPLLSIRSSFSAALDQACSFLPEDAGIQAWGTVRGSINGNIQASQLKIAQFAKADIKADLSSDDIRFNIGKEMSGSGGTIAVALSTSGDKFDDSVRKGTRTLTATVKADTVAFRLANMAGNGKSLSVKAQNSADIISRKQKYYPFSGTVQAGLLSVVQDDGLSIKISNTSDSFRIRVNSDIPTLSLNGNLKAIVVRSGVNRFGGTDVRLGANAKMVTLQRNAMRRAMMDSLSKAFPDTPKDSLIYKAFPAKDRPDWLKDDDFRKKDINIDIGKTLYSYYRDWDMSGDIELSRAFIATPYYPLRTGVNALKGSFTNNSIKIDSLRIKSGVSDLSARGSITDLRRLLSKRGAASVEMDINSGRIDLDEIMAAFEKGAGTVHTNAMEMLDDASYEKAVTLDSIRVNESGIKAFIVPSNLNANLTLVADTVSISGIRGRSFRSYLAMKERCIQLTNSSAVTDYGMAFLEGFYSTRTKKDMKLGCYLNLNDIPVEKVMQMIPSVDSIAPVLNNFSGQLNCQAAATARIDKDMNLLMPSISGVARLYGEDLKIVDNSDFTSIARKLFFKNPKTGKVDALSIDGFIENNKVEIFPFVLTMDRYQLAMSGIQNMDKSFKYHVSVLKSPVPFKVGVDLGGSFDNVKWGIGKPKYKNANVPAFTAVIKSTTVSLMDAIHNIFSKGADKAVEENEAQNDITRLKKDINYVQAVDQPIEALSKIQQRKLELLSNIPDSVSIDRLGLDTLSTEQFDSLSVEKLDSLIRN